MKKLLISLFLTLVFFYDSVTPINSFHTAHAQKPIPSYAKWGRLAMEKTHERYPNAKIIDYLHIGRTSGPTYSTERFKLWLKDSNREFGVFIHIEFDSKTEKVIKITFKESAT